MRRIRSSPDPPRKPRQNARGERFPRVGVRTCPAQNGQGRFCRGLHDLTLKLAIVKVICPNRNRSPGTSRRKLKQMGSVERTRELRRRRSRKVKLKKLRARFAKAANETEKATILAQ